MQLIYAIDAFRSLTYRYLESDMTEWIKLAHIPFQNEVLKVAYIRMP